MGEAGRCRFPLILDGSSDRRAIGDFFESPRAILNGSRMVCGPRPALHKIRYSICRAVRGSVRTGPVVVRAGDGGNCIGQNHRSRTAAPQGSIAQSWFPRALQLCATRVSATLLFLKATTREYVLNFAYCVTRSFARPLLEWQTSPSRRLFSARTPS